MGLKLSLAALLMAVLAAAFFVYEGMWEGREARLRDFAPPPAGSESDARPPSPALPRADSVLADSRRPLPPPQAPPVPNARDGASKWERVERHCPWPPTRDAWTEVSGECDAAMMDLDPPRPYPDWLRDTDGTRRAVVAALDDPHCRVPPGERRPDLHGACAAEAMIRLAKMQHACLYVLGKDWSNRPETGLAIVERGDLEEYHRLVEAADRSFAERMWGYSLCARLPHGVLDWIDTLPAPSEESDSAISVPTQAPELFEAARRLGASVRGFPYGFDHVVMPWLPGPARTRAPELFGAPRR